ncbi:hypothetical protein E2C01_019057 [Portunus trituberculatus]|uniref:Uncharacterized protein n=1 Tax=Portunus trituberculatus TaxID=210409 RepID=A0A5B7DYS9_PORTR|nr:hypothetical protein [Portunus trituberculatus]
MCVCVVSHLSLASSSITASSLGVISSLMSLTNTPDAAAAVASSSSPLLISLFKEVVDKYKA